VEERPTESVLNLKGVEHQGPQIPVVDDAGWDTEDEEIKKAIGRQLAKARGRGGLCRC